MNGPLCAKCQEDQDKIDALRQKSESKAEERRELTWCASDNDGCGTMLALAIGGLLTAAAILVKALA